MTLTSTRKPVGTGMILTSTSMTIILTENTLVVGRHDLDLHQHATMTLMLR